MAHLATTPPAQVDENLVTPGPWGFFIFFGIAVATILLVLDMTRRIRRTRYRAELREQLEREQLENDQNPTDKL